MTTEAHAHHWKLARDMTRDVPGECACGAKRVFKGYDMEGEFERLRRSPLGVSILSYGAKSK